MTYKTAQKSYEAAQQTAASLIAKLQQLLQADTAEFAQYPGNWGSVGDLNHVNDLLTEAVEHMNGSNY